MSILLLAILCFCQIFAIFCAIFLLKRWFNHQKQLLIDTAKAYFEPQSPEEQSQFGAFVDLTAQTFARRLVQSARASLANLSSIDTRQNDKLGNIALDGGDITAAASSLGIGKMMRKNPLLGLAAQYLMGKIMPQNNTPTPTEVGAMAASRNGESNPFVL
jgi:hypothetical protein